MHAIAIDLDTGVIQIEITGFWTPAHVEVFAADVRDASRKVKQAGKRQAILYDYTEAKIQSPEVIAELQHLAQ